MQIKPRMNVYRWMSEKESDGYSWHLGSWQRSVETIFVPRVISCLFGVSSRGPSSLFLQFPFSPFFTSSLSPAGRGRWDSALSEIVPVYGPADPTSLLLNTLAHNGGSVTQAPNLLQPSPKKQETGTGRALVFLLISCFAAPSPDYFLYFFRVPLRLALPNQLFVI